MVLEVLGIGLVIEILLEMQWAPRMEGLCTRVKSEKLREQTHKTKGTRNLSS